MLVTRSGSGFPSASGPGAGGNSGSSTVSGGGGGHGGTTKVKSISLISQRNGR